MKRIHLGIIGNRNKENIAASIRHTIDWLRDRGIACLVEADLAAEIGEGIQPGAAVPLDDLVRGSDVVISFGGDGTMLASAQLTMRYDKPLLGVNLGKLGFLAEVTPAELDSVLETLIDGRYIVEERLAIQGSYTGNERVFVALNDIVLSRGGAARGIMLNTYVDEEFLAAFHADGIIVATPTGSTAYSLATGGPIVAPSSNVLVISPISAHTLTARPVVVPSGASVRVEASVDEGEILLMVDGQMHTIDRLRTEVAITRAPRGVKLVKREGSSYFDTLRNKLMWGKDTRI